MAFGRKKENPSSRYSRRKDEWADEDEYTSGRGPTVRDESYGVQDSYRRQASYGRPEGYYGGDVSGYAAGDTKVMPARRIRREALREETLRRDEMRFETQDDWDDPDYDDRLEECAPERAAARAPRRRRETARETAQRESYSGRGRQDRAYERTERSKASFIWKIILLIIAAGVLLVFWRLSRMEHMSLSGLLKNEGVTGHDGVQDFVIYGVDSREGRLTEEAHSDTIILCSMNRKAGTVKLVSVYRDTYLDNTNGEYRKATECYYFGGPQRSVSMLNKNLDLDLKDYLTVDFRAVVKAVDLIGGVEVEVTEDELPYINGYQTENAEVTGAEITPVTQAGYQLLNGIQALAYCRIRYTEGSDYRRTERQRAVLEQVFARAKSQGPVKLAQLVDTMLPDISTSFSSPQLIGLATSLQDCSISETTGFPFDLQAANISAGDCVVPVNLAQNVSQLHAFLYGEQGYEPSQTVQQISDQIAAATGIYG